MRLNIVIKFFQDGDGMPKVYLETHSPLYAEATAFLVAIAEPLTRPHFVHEYRQGVWGNRPSPLREVIASLLSLERPGLFFLAICPDEILIWTKH